MSGTSVPSRWFSFPRSQPQATTRLFCFPYAGGGARIFREWPDALPASVEVCAVQLPGREIRVRESCFTRLPLLVQEAAREILPYLDRPFAFFGHSMGALISFELARYLRRHHTIDLPSLFVSGCCAPQLSNQMLPSYDLSEAGFLTTLRRLSGTPNKVLEHPEFMQLLLPMLRADFEMINSYVYSAESPLDCPLTAFSGALDEEVSRESLAAWREQTASRFSLEILPGGHFFLHESRPILLEVLSRYLSTLEKGFIRG